MSFVAAALMVMTVAPGTVFGAVSLSSVATGLSKPVFVTNAGDGSNRLFIVEQTGRIRIVDGGVLLPQPFLDLSASISTGGERGLLGLAFHPDYATNGKFYVNFTRGNGDTVINEYQRSISNPNIANRSSARRIMTIGQPYSNHNGGMLAFGSDGYLYIGMGDGGRRGDPGNRAQNLNSLLGKMLRIDINGTSSGRAYRIPATNPWVGKPGLDEIWSRGLRNPWRFSFDRVNGTCGSATSARAATRRSTAARLPRASAAAPTTAGGCSRARECYNPVDLQSDRPRRCRSLAVLRTPGALRGDRRVCLPRDGLAATRRHATSSPTSAIGPDLHGPGRRRPSWPSRC